MNNKRRQLIKRLLIAGATYERIGKELKTPEKPKGVSRQRAMKITQNLFTPEEVKEFRQRRFKKLGFKP